MTKNSAFYTPHFGHVTRLRNIFQGHDTFYIFPQKLINHPKDL